MGAMPLRRPSQQGAFDRPLVGSATSSIGILAPQPARAAVGFGSTPQVENSYQGQFFHPAFGQQHHDITVQILSPTAGHWFAMGQLSTIVVKIDGDHVLLDDGTTLMDGVIDALGVIRGQMIQEGAPGGSFVLKPINQSGSAQLQVASYVGTQPSFVAAPPIMHAAAPGSAHDLSRVESLVLPVTPGTHPRPMSVKVKGESAAVPSQPMRALYQEPPQSQHTIWQPQAAPQRPRSYIPPVLPNTVPTIEGVEHLAPERVQELLQSGECVLVDVRGDDRASGLIEGTVHVAASTADKVPWKAKVPELVQRFARNRLIVFTCQYSAHRAPQCANWYREKAPAHQRVAILEGGFRNWEAKGLPVVSPGADAAGLLTAGGGADEFAMKQGVQFVKQHVPLLSQFFQRNQQPTYGIPQVATQRTNTSAQSLDAPVRGLQVAQPRRYVAPKPLTAVPTKDGVEHLEPEIVTELLSSGRCVLIDLRGDDRASGLIEGAMHIPAIDKEFVPFLTRVPDLVKKFAGVQIVVFTCQYSVHRAPQCANWYREKAPVQQIVAILSGGFRGWEAKGFPVMPMSNSPEEGPGLSAVSQAADEYAMQQGVRFVQRFVPKVYERARQDLLMQSQPPPEMEEKNWLQESLVQWPQPPPPPPAPPPPPTEKVKPREKARPAQKGPPASDLRWASPPLPVQRDLVPYAPPSTPTTVPTIDGVEHLKPESVFDLLKDGKCILVDLRGEDRVAGLIKGAEHVPAIDKTTPFPSKVPDLVRRYGNQNLVVFTCQYSLHRAPQCANWYREKAPSNQRVAVLSGGFRGWEAQGLPIAFAAIDAHAAAAADDNAMQLGVSFVKQYAPAVYVKAKQALQEASDNAGNSQQQIERQLHEVQPQQQAVQENQEEQAVAEAAVSSTKRPREANNGKDGNLQDFGNGLPDEHGIQSIEAEALSTMLRDKYCVIVDVRDADRVSGTIDGSQHVAAIDTVPFASKVPRLVQQNANVPMVVFMCQYSRHRAQHCAKYYREKAHPMQQVAVLAGGFRSWEAKGLPVTRPSDGKATNNQAADQGAKEAPDQTRGRRSSARPSSIRQQSPNGVAIRQQSPNGVSVRQQSPNGSEQPQRSRQRGQKDREQRSSADQAIKQKRAQAIQQAATAQTQQNGGVVLAAPNPEAMGVDTLEPQQVSDLLRSGSCILVDVRDDDRAAGLIDGAVHVPAIDQIPFTDKVPDLVRKFSAVGCVVFTCQYSRHRAPQCAGWYRDAADERQRVGILKGGFRGWEAQGFPVASPAATRSVQNKADATALMHGQRFIQQYGSPSPGKAYMEI